MKVKYNKGKGQLPYKLARLSAKQTSVLANLQRQWLVRINEGKWNDANTFSEGWSYQWLLKAYELISWNEWLGKYSFDHLSAYIYIYIYIYNEKLQKIIVDFDWSQVTFNEAWSATMETLQCIFSHKVNSQSKSIQEFGPENKPKEHLYLLESMLLYILVSSVSQ